MKFEFKWPSGLRENCFNIMMGLQIETLAERSALTFGTYL